MQLSHSYTKFNLHMTIAILNTNTTIQFFPPLQSYFKDNWNTFDFVTVVGSIVDALMVEFAVSIPATNAVVE